MGHLAQNGTEMWVKDGETGIRIGNLKDISRGVWRGKGCCLR